MKNVFKTLGGLRQLLSSIDLDQISKLSEKVDISKMVGLVSQMSEEDLSKMMGMMKGGSKPKIIPPVNGDFYELGKSLPSHERDIQLRVRDISGLWLSRTLRIAGRFCSHGNGQNRHVDLYFFRGAKWFGYGFDLPMWIRRAEERMASSYAENGKNWCIWINRT